MGESCLLTVSVSPVLKCAEKLWFCHVNTAPNGQISFYNLIEDPWIFLRQIQIRCSIA